MADDADTAVWKRLFGDYSDAFLDHSYQPRNVGSIPDADVHVRHTGPCGDTIELCIKMKSGVISEITFIPDGCEGTTACGSALTELARGKRVKDASAISAASIENYLDGLAEEHKHCAGLAVSVLHQAIAQLIRKTRSW
ncbi:iron-sulfur cluster assembly scaffold protein [candidate division WOR-3 bacterium]|uniref:Iron-sulfur cluster assembly scaffold protein n=1 Tax=candidate division WOR-3 bacterium TaxID=2052148 RepID=A0A9D5QDW6_UNCW3|nr:iron-sulfur cluster assembly scaffold protein [candidate division WOR-3 bacterium]MBD3365471.1 iron-sulfur cluster assembly scaffold protein [candidate division WOR-3 bacterium]